MSTLLPFQSSLDSLDSADQQCRSHNSSVMIKLHELMKTTQHNHNELLGLTQTVIAEVQVVKTDCQKLWTSIDRLSIEANKAARVECFLKSLDFAEMSDRGARIKDSYSDTFAWIFEQDTTPFKTWLESSSNETFWICGKAGSGKSTLMKFVAEHPCTTQILKSWAGSSQLIVADFFFWNPGVALQKAIEGFWRTVLFKVFHQCPSLIPAACPTRWSACKDLRTSLPRWTPTELDEAFKALIHNDALPVRFCFFIDGLDECEGEHDDLLLHLAQYTISTNAKFCVSSRPYNVFKEEYGNRKSASFTLQDLTKSDMDKYIRGELESCERFVQLCQREPRAIELVQDIRERACGVFLWVYLVVKEMRKGLRERDNLSTLIRRLNNVPPDLRDLFKQILDKVDEVYFAHSARALQIALYSPRPRPLLTYWALQEDIEDHQWAFKMECRAPTLQEVLEMETEAAFRINSWCRDLLETVNRGEQDLQHCESPALMSFNLHKVDLLHRTVKEFLMEPAMQDYLQTRARKFDLWTTLSRLFLGKTKMLLPSFESGTQMAGFLDLASTIMALARKSELQTKLAETAPVLEELDMVGTYLRCKGSGDASHWSNLNMKSTRAHPCSNFLAYAVTFGLGEYVGHTLDRTPAHQRVSLSPLYFFAMNPPPIFDGSAEYGESGLPQHAILELLSQKGVRHENAVRVYGEPSEESLIVLTMKGGALQSMYSAHGLRSRKFGWKQPVDCLDPHCGHSAPIVHRSNSDANAGGDMQDHIDAVEPDSESAYNSESLALRRSHAVSTQDLGDPQTKGEHERVSGRTSHEEIIWRYGVWDLRYAYCFISLAQNYQRDGWNGLRSNKKLLATERLCLHRLCHEPMIINILSVEPSIMHPASSSTALVTPAFRLPSNVTFAILASTPCLTNPFNLSVPSSWPPFHNNLINPSTNKETLALSNAPVPLAANRA